MITILSPAKKLDEQPSERPAQHSKPELIEDSKILVDTIRNLSPEDIKELMNVSQEIAEINFERYARWSPPFTPENAKKAIFMFDGQVYKGIEPETLSFVDLEFAQAHVRILSGLYGILRPLDLIQPYRLEMGTKLENPRGKDLYEFWGNKITEKINEAMEGHTNKALINLASGEYFKAVKPSNIDGDIITPTFKEKKGKDYKIVAVYAKKARGLMTRFIVKNKIADPEHLKSFEEEGYSFNNHLSSENEWVFTR